MNRFSPPPSLVDADVRARLDAEDLRMLALLADGVAGTRLARELGYSSATTRRRLQGVRERLGVATTIEAVVIVVRAGLV